MLGFVPPPVLAPPFLPKPAGPNPVDTLPLNPLNPWYWPPLPSIPINFPDLPDWLFPPPGPSEPPVDPLPGLDPGLNDPNPAPFDPEMPDGDWPIPQLPGTDAPNLLPVHIKYTPQYKAEDYRTCSNNDMITPGEPWRDLSQKEGGHWVKSAYIRTQKAVTQYFCESGTDTSEYHSILQIVGVNANGTESAVDLYSGTTYLHHTNGTSYHVKPQISQVRIDRITVNGQPIPSPVPEPKPPVKPRPLPIPIKPLPIPQPEPAPVPLPEPEPLPDPLTPPSPDAPDKPPITIPKAPPAKTPIAPPRDPVIVPGQWPQPVPVEVPVPIPGVPPVTEPIVVPEIFPAPGPTPQPDPPVTPDPGPVPIPDVDPGVTPIPLPGIDPGVSPSPDLLPLPEGAFPIFPWRPPVPPANDIVPTTPRGNHYPIPGGPAVTPGGARADLQAIADEVGRIEAKGASSLERINTILNLLDALEDLLGDGTLPAVTYELKGICEDVEEDADQPRQSWIIPETDKLDALGVRVDTIAEMLQVHLGFKTPTCGGDKRPVLKGNWISIHFESAQDSPNGERPLRKLFRYRSDSSRSHEELRAYWDEFTWDAGATIVVHKGYHWGTPKVWAASEAEGKRVIRFAATESGFDPDTEGEWVVSSSDNSRYGMTGKMYRSYRFGIWWLTSRNGPSELPWQSADS